MEFVTTGWLRGEPKRCPVRNARFSAIAGSSGCGHLSEKILHPICRWWQNSPNLRLAALWNHSGGRFVVKSRN